ncbi:MAG: D-2-hydroxyacid dehydrogenase [Pirellulaceae bacterium]
MSIHKTLRIEMARGTVNRTNIVALDGGTLNPGDNPWDQIAELGELQVHANSHTDQIVARAHDASVLLVNKVRLGANEFNELPNLKLISVTATGFNNIDTAAARQTGITVCNVPVYGTQTVAQYTMAAILHAIYRIDLHDHAIRNGEWARRGEFSFWLTPQFELAGKTIGIVGLGRIGSAVAQLASAFGMQVVAYSPRATNRETEFDFEWVELESLFRQSDVISLHCPQTDSNAGFINSTLLKNCKPNAILVNASRGGLICEQDLCDELNYGTLAAACLDVVSKEPIEESNPLFLAKNCFLTPHLAWATIEARKRLMSETHDNVVSFLNGSPRNVVN